jgi:hypothetical protein
MKLSVLLAITLVFVSAASAAPLCVAGGTMASYKSLGSGGCTIGNALFSNFIYLSTASGTGAVVPDTAVFLTPAGDTFNPGIVFSTTGWTIPSGSLTDDSLVDSTIKFTVSILDGTSTLEDGTLTLSSYAVSGTGFADITETIKPSSIQLQVDSGGPFVSHLYFPPTNSVSVLKDLVVAVPQGSTGTASISMFEEDFSEAPEPVSTVLIGSGLLGLGLWRRRAVRRA